MKFQTVSAMSCHMARARTCALACALACAWLCAIGVAQPAAAAHTAGPCTEAAQTYWKTFRQAVQRNDAVRLADLAAFPFDIKPTLDSTETRQVAREEFIRLVPGLLKTNPGLTANPTSMQRFTQTHRRLSASFCNAQGNQVRVGAWLFQLKPQGWRFVQAVVDE